MDLVTSEYSPIKDLHAAMWQHDLSTIIRAKQYVDEMEACVTASRKEDESKQSQSRG